MGNCRSQGFAELHVATGWFVMKERQVRMKELLLIAGSPINHFYIKKVLFDPQAGNVVEVPASRLQTRQLGQFSSSFLGNYL